MRLFLTWLTTPLPPFCPIGQSNVGFRGEQGLTDKNAGWVFTSQRPSPISIY